MPHSTMLMPVRLPVTPAAEDPVPALDDVADRHERFQGGVWIEAGARESDRALRLLRLLGEAADRLADFDPEAAAHLASTLERGRLCMSSFGEKGSVSANHRCTLFADHDGDCVFGTRGAKSGDYPVSRSPQPERLHRDSGAAPARST